MAPDKGEFPPLGATPPNGFFNRIPSILHKSAEDEDQDEWEYEYSTTETETYYVTLDLTIPNAPPKRRIKPMGRGGSTRRWVNPTTKRSQYSEYSYPTTHRRSKPTTEGGGVGGEDEDEEETGRREHEVQFERGSGEENEKEKTPNKSKAKVLDFEAFMTMFDANQPQGKAKVLAAEPADNAETKDEIQILEIHTENPLVSFGRQIYSCQWAENKGTELLFTAQEPNSTLPILRSLPDSIDLLGAISARIISTPATMETKKVPTRARTPEFPPTYKGKDPSIKISVGYQALDKRKDQARFLEKLIELKERKGEPDFVTVHAQKRLLNSQWRLKANVARDGERARLKKLIGQKKRGAEVDNAKSKLEEMDREDEQRAQEEINNRRNPDGSKIEKTGPKGRKRKYSEANPKPDFVRRPTGPARIMAERVGEMGNLEGYGGTKTPSVAESENVDVTPRVRWADMEDEEDQEESEQGEGSYLDDEEQMVESSMEGDEDEGQGEEVQMEYYEEEEDIYGEYDTGEQDDTQIAFAE